MRTPKLSFRSILLLPLLAGPALAADLIVASGGSIQTAIDQAVDGDRVLVEPGTYTEQLDFLGKSIEVIGTKGPGLTILSGAGAGPVVRFAAGEGAASRLAGFTVTGGSAGFGAGGVACASGATPTITDCIIRNNVGKFGGGVSGSPTMRRVVVVDNTASLTHGGGVYGAPDMAFCVVASNTATSADGGGLYLTGGAAKLTDCVVVENAAVFAGSHAGGIHVDSTATVTIERTLIASNFSTGGVFAGYGGGVRVEAAGTAVLDRCVVVDNSVTGSSTFGAGVYGPATITNSIVRDNTGAPQIDGADSVAWSDVEGGYVGTGNVDVDPGFVDAAQRDYHLLASSLLIDAGDPALVDPDGTRADIGAFPFATMYARVNGQTADWTDPAWPELDSMIGGRQSLGILAGPASGGGLYLVLGTYSGQVPGVDVLGAHLPLNPDPWFNYTLNHPNSAVMQGSFGILDASGAATASIVVPADPNALLGGFSFAHATLCEVPGRPAAFATSAVGLELVP